jgi:hypothetical protein
MRRKRKKNENSIKGIVEELKMGHCSNLYNDTLKVKCV